MANLATDTRFGVMQQAFYTFNTTAGTPLYIHLKTNIPKGSGYMFYIEAEGYNYNLSAPVLCSWTGYPYGATQTLINTSVENFYGGMNADGMYQSTDNYVVLRAYAGGHYFNGFTLNSVMANPSGTGIRVAILDAIQSSTSGNYY